jgi:uncharacterized protein (DUF3820 family)
VKHDEVNAGKGGEEGGEEHREVGLEPNREELASLLEARMPFGKYAGQRLLDLPEAYLVWFSRQGFPRGKLGERMRSVLELKANGLLGVLNPLRSRE